MDEIIEQHERFQNQHPDTPCVNGHFECAIDSDGRCFDEALSAVDFLEEGGD